MEFRYPEESKSWSEETDDESDQNNEDHSGSGRCYECVFCKRGFTTAQALGGHMNIHRKDRAKTSKPSFAASSSSTKVVDDISYAISSHPPRNYNYYYTSPEVDADADTNYNNSHHQISFPAVPPPCGISTVTPSEEVLCVENRRDRNVFGGSGSGRDYWRRGFGIRENNKHKVEDHSSEEDGLDLELRLGYHP